MNSLKVVDGRYTKESIEDLIKRFDMVPAMDLLCVLPDPKDEPVKPSAITRDLKIVSKAPSIIYEREYQYAVVIAVGPGRRYVDKAFVGFMAPTVKPGQRVCTGLGAPEYKFDDITLQIISEVEVRLVEK
jgi:hypothetical protein